MATVTFSASLASLAMVANLGYMCHSGALLVPSRAQALHRGVHLLPRAQSQHKKADSTLRSSRAVPHPSTDRALRRLTSEVRRDPVHSTRYGRQRSHIYFGSSRPEHRPEHRICVFVFWVGALCAPLCRVVAGC